MVFEQIEKLKQEYTDKFVEVAGDRPELARFKDVIGQVKTINMSGRALVEFLDYHQNIGWYDIALDYLRIVDPPGQSHVESRWPGNCTEVLARRFALRGVGRLLSQEVCDGDRSGGGGGGAF